MVSDPRLDELAVAYLTGEISAADLIDLELRLKADPSARERLAELSEQEMALRQIFLQQENQRQLPPDSRILPVAETRRGGTSGVMRARRSRAVRSQRVRRKSGTFWVPLTLAASFLLFLLLFFMGRQTGERPHVAQVPEDPPSPTPVPQPKSNTPKTGVRTAQVKPVGSVVFVAPDSGHATGMSVRRVEGDREQRLPLVEGMPVLAGDRIETGPRDSGVAERRPVRAAVTFSSGATLDLADETRLEAISDAEIKVDSGLFYADTLAELPASRLTVRTPGLQVQSRLVCMDVLVAPERTAVAVESGRAEVRNDQGSVTVGSKTMSIALKGRAPSLPVAIYASQMWRGRKGPIPSAPVRGELAVLSFTLIDADRDVPIAEFDPMPTGEVVLNLAELPTRNLNIRANTVPADGISVRFDLNNKIKYKLEQYAPYAFNGDSRDAPGDYIPWTPKPGTYDITATPFPDHTAMKKPGKSLRIKVKIVDR